MIFTKIYFFVLKSQGREPEPRQLHCLQFLKPSLLGGWKLVKAQTHNRRRYFRHWKSQGFELRVSRWCHEEHQIKILGPKAHVSESYNEGDQSTNGEGNKAQVDV